MNRTQPYTDAGLARKTCAHCRERKCAHQWSLTVCANNRKRFWVGVCTSCDIAFNRQALEFVHHPDTKRLMAEYAEARA